MAKALRLILTVVGATVVALAATVAIGVLAAGCGGTPAGSATSSQRGGATASVVGTVVFARRHFGVDVHVFDASSAPVASEYVPPDADRFRFDLPPGQYELELSKHLAPVTCHYEKAASVRAHRTTHVTFVAAILDPGCGTY
jgi:hypothetical protein